MNLIPRPQDKLSREVCQTLKEKLSLGLELPIAGLRQLWHRPRHRRHQIRHGKTKHGKQAQTTFDCTKNQQWATRYLIPTAFCLNHQFDSLMMSYICLSTPDIERHFSSSTKKLGKLLQGNTDLQYFDLPPLYYGAIQSKVRIRTTVIWKDWELSLLAINCSSGETKTPRDQSKALAIVLIIERPLFQTA